MSANDLVSVVIITFKRQKDLMETIQNVFEQDYENIEVIIVDNEGNAELEQEIARRFSERSIQYYNPGKNLGVPAGRNYGYKKANGRYILNIDDDAILAKQDSISKAVEKFHISISLGCLAFKIINYYSGNILSKEFPHPDMSKKDMEMEVGLFIGAGFMFDNEKIGILGYFNEDYFYSMEELDLSYRIIEAGYDIVYYPEVEVLHKISPAGRLPSNMYFEYGIINRFKIAARFLPGRYTWIYLFIWTGYFFLSSLKNKKLKLYFKSMKTGIRSFKEIIYNHERKVLSKATINKLKKVGGRLYY